jgi:hypothetical protein
MLKLFLFQIALDRGSPSIGKLDPFTRPAECKEIPVDIGKVQRTEC